MVFKAINVMIVGYQYLHLWWKYPDVCFVYHTHRWCSDFITLQSCHKQTQELCLTTLTLKIKRNLREDGQRGSRQSCVMEGWSRWVSLFVRTSCPLTASWSFVWFYFSLPEMWWTLCCTAALKIRDIRLKISPHSSWSFQDGAKDRWNDTRVPAGRAVHVSCTLSFDTQTDVTAVSPHLNIQLPLKPARSV